MDVSEQDQPRRRIRVPGFLVDQEIGLGSAIKRVTASVGVPTCGGCQRRAAQLDRRVVLQGPRRTGPTDTSIGGHHHGL